MPSSSESDRKASIHCSVACAQRHAGPLSAGYRLVIDVGVIDDFGNPVSAQVFQRAAQHIEADEGPEIADVSAT